MTNTKPGSEPHKRQMVMSNVWSATEGAALA